MQAVGCCFSLGLRRLPERVLNRSWLRNHSGKNSGGKRESFRKALLHAAKKNYNQICAAVDTKFIDIIMLED